MSLATCVADVIQQHVSLTVECVDRLYLNVIQTRLQVERGIANFFQQHRGERFATAKTMAEVTRPFATHGSSCLAQTKTPQQETDAAGAWIPICHNESHCLSVNQT